MASDIWVFIVKLPTGNADGIEHYPGGGNEGTDNANTNKDCFVHTYLFGIPLRENSQSLRDSLRS